MLALNCLGPKIPLSLHISLAKASYMALTYQQGRYERAQENLVCPNSLSYN
jgi:hypothetical protein